MLHSANDEIRALKIQMLQSGKQISNAVNQLKVIQNLNTFGDQTAELVKISVKLEDSALFLSTVENKNSTQISGRGDLSPLPWWMNNPPSTVDNSSQSNKSDVCPEVYLGNTRFVFYHYPAWQMEDCSDVTSMDKLITILFSAADIESVERMTDSLWDVYPEVKVLVEGNLEIDIEEE